MSISWAVRGRLLLVVLAAAVLTVGCSEGPLQSPAGPSPVGSTTFLSDGDAAATSSSADVFNTLAKGGNGKGGSKKPDHAGGDASDAEIGSQPDDIGGPGRSQESRVVGFVTANNGDTIVVNGVTIAVGLDALIRHGNRILTMADIAVGDHVQARGAMEGTALVAVEIKVQDTGNDNVAPDPNAADIEGAISGLPSPLTCPAMTFMVGATKVTTTAATTFDDVACAALTNGAIVDVEGTTQADGSILATEVELQSGPDEVIGTVFELAGTASCGTATPALTFKVGPTPSLATAVTTTTTTSFSGVTCAALANGARVEVEGTQQADGSITAASVELD